MIRWGMILFAVNLIFGLYFLNLGTNFISLPSFLVSANNLINIVAGILLVLGGFIAMRSFSYRRIR